MFGAFRAGVVVCPLNLRLPAARKRDRLERLDAAEAEVRRLVDGACQAVAYDYGATEARRRLVRLVADSRARGIALRTAAAVAGLDGRAYMLARLEGRQLDPAPEPVLMETLAPLVERVESLGGAPATAAMDADLPVADCGPVPFLLD